MKRLRNKHCEVIVKYGHCSSSHAHPDKMNIEVSAFETTISRDLSNCGYALRLCNEYHRTSVAHNTVVVNGKSHPTTNLGKCVIYDETLPQIEVFSKNAYDKIDFQRNLTVNANGFCDKFTAISDQTQVYDLFFHLEGTFISDYEFVPAELGFNQNGYQHLQHVTKLQGNFDTVTFTWSFANGVKGLQLISLKEVELYMCKSYDNPVNRLRNTMILRRNSKIAAFT